MDDEMEQSFGRYGRLYVAIPASEGYPSPAARSAACQVPKRSRTVVAAGRSAVACSHPAAARHGALGARCVLEGGNGLLAGPGALQRGETGLSPGFAHEPNTLMTCPPLG